MYIELTDEIIWISKNASLCRVLANRVTYANIWMCVCVCVCLFVFVRVSVLEVEWSLHMFQNFEGS